MRTIITDELKEKICNEYLNGKSITKLSKEYHKKSETISRILKENNIKVIIGLRPRVFTEQENNYIIQSINNHSGIKEIAKHLGIDQATAKKQIEKLGLHASYRAKNRSINENYFSSIDTEEKAYFLGLMYTDGSVRKNGATKQIRISLQLKDEHILRTFLKELNSDVALLYDKRPGKEAVGFEICNEKLFDDLYALGVIPNKTYLSNSFPKVSEEFKIPFLRGLFDGDGVLSYKENYNEASIGFVSYSLENVQKFQATIDALIEKENSNSIYYKNDKTGSSYRCSWRGRRQVLKILEMLYKDSKIHLNRKYEKYLRLLSTVADKDMV